MLLISLLLDGVGIVVNPIAYSTEVLVKGCPFQFELGSDVTRTLTLRKTLYPLGFALNGALP